MENKKKIVLAFPGDEFSSKFLLNFADTIISLFASSKYTFTIAQGTGSFVPFVRMSTLGLDVRRGIKQKPFNGDHFDYWITIDSDIIFTPHQIFELLESLEKYPIVAGMYKMADLQNYAMVKEWNMDYKLKHGHFEFLSETDFENWKKSTNKKYFKVDYTGLGFFGCRKEVLYKMQYPYFDGELMDAKAKDGTIIKELNSEDVNFCHNINKLGYNIMINSNIRVGHLKKIII